jgi:putative flippase GtrA
MKFMGRESIRFVLAGGLNSVLTYLLFCGLLQVVTYTVAYTASYIAGIVLSYILNCCFVYRARPALRSALKYPLVYVVQYGLGLLLLALFVKNLGLDPRLAALAVVFFSVPVTYILTRYILKKPVSSLRANI